MKKVIVGLIISILCVSCKKDEGYEGTLKVLVSENCDYKHALIYDVANESIPIKEIRIYAGEEEQLKLNCGNYVVKIGDFKQGFQILFDETVIVDFREYNLKY